MNKKFPTNGCSEKELRIILDQHFSEIQDWNESDGYRFGFAMTAPHPIALKTLNKFLPKNNNNTGMHTPTPDKQLSGTRFLEKEAIKMIADLLHDRKADGNITTGGTESNITGVWLGRNLLKKRGFKKIVMFTTELTHVSFTKASNLLNIDLVLIPLNSNYEMDYSLILKRMEILKRQNYDAFIFCLTFGYFTTGGHDNVSEICRLLEKYKNCIYIHVDACIGGFIYPFSNPKLRFDFRSKMVSSISLDPHKMGLMPYSCGVFLCRKNLWKYIETNNSLAHFPEKTLSGSRGGASAAALWALLNYLGRDGYKKIVSKSIANKNYFINKIKHFDPHALILSSEDINHFAVHFSFFEGNLLPSELSKKYRIVANKLPVISSDGERGHLDFYHFFVMPHMTKNGIDKFISDLSDQNL